MKEADDPDRGPGAASDGPETGGEGTARDGAAWDEALAALRQATGELGEMRAHLLRLGRVQLDRVRLALRRGGFRIVFLAWAVLVGAALSVLASVFFVNGVAGGIAATLAVPAWAGQLLAGLGLLASVGLGFAIARRRRRRAEIDRLLQRYESDGDGTNGTSGSGDAARALEDERGGAPRVGSTARPTRPA